MSLSLAAVAFISGCNTYPEVASREAISLIAALRTACNTKSPQRLDRVNQSIERAHANGTLSPHEHAAFADIVSLARNGQWQDAEYACADFQEAQIR